MLREEANDTPGQATHEIETNKSRTKVSLSSATRPAGQFKCVGAIRKAGFLSVKKWILKRKQSIELARKQGWKRYWVCLRGTTLLFYSVVDKREVSAKEAAERTCLLDWIQSNCASQHHSEHLAGSTPKESLLQCYIEKEPRHLIIIEGAIAQPIPEHPKRDFVFCLSTTFGDAYLFQAACQSESDNWISAIHNACAASIARDLTRDEATKLFENKIRHLEIEAEKKLFLRQRLESRLTSMSSMSHIALDDTMQTSLSNRQDNEEDDGEEAGELEESGKRKRTMRSLLARLNQQLSLLDIYIEQVHCEIYQLRCYIASCGSQRIFYRQQWTTVQSRSDQQQQQQSLALAAIDLPHPKALLVHVSKPTKLILIRLGVFTVSSFHAYIHARQGSAESIMQRIQRRSSSEQSPTVELRVRSRSLSEQMFSNRLLENVKLDNDTEKLIDMSNFKQITIRVSKTLHEKIISTYSNKRKSNDGSRMSTQDTKKSKNSDGRDGAENSDDRYSVHEDGEYILVNMRIHPSSSTLKVIEQLLNILEPNGPEMEFLNYYLRFDIQSSDNHNVTKTEEVVGVVAISGDHDSGCKENYVAKRTETVGDWSANLHTLELVEKIVFRLELTRRQIEEEASPFGISIGVRLFEGKLESLLSVHCSYIEWGSVADKAGLRDDDDLLVINGVPVMDLDMMFVESLIQDDTRLRLVVRSSRSEPPASAQALESRSWRASPGSSNEDANKELDSNNNEQDKFRHNLMASSGHTQVFSDEYISTLVCPPPPDKSGAFLRAPESNPLMRQKSDLPIRGAKRTQSIKTELVDLDDCGKDRSAADRSECCNLMVKAKSQHNIDSSLIGNDLASVESAMAGKGYITNELLHNEPSQQAERAASTSLAAQLLRKTEQLTRLLGKTALEGGGCDELDETSKGETEAGDVSLNASKNATATSTKKLTYKADRNPNAIERLRKSILELIETEFAYIRHLETISEHYFSPLEDMSFLSITDLKHLNEIVSSLIGFQREFFEKLSHGFCGQDLSESTAATSADQSADEFDELNRLVQHLDSIKDLTDFEQPLKWISQTFLDEAEKFKIYSAYCAAYSRLQKLLHPKRSLRVPSASIMASPAALDTFLISNVSTVSSQIAGTSGLNVVSGGGSRDFLKPLGSFMGTSANSPSPIESANTNENSKSQLKQLNDFLVHLDSSSSSVSLSLPKSSGSGGNQKASSANKQASSSVCATTAFHKSAHQQSFESYLIKPIQRIVKYPMLLNSIALSAAQAGASEELREALQKALRHMESITSHVNDTQRVHDEYGTIFEQIERLFLKQLCDAVNQSRPVMGPHQPTIGLSLEQLLYFGQVDWLNILEFNPKMKTTTNLIQHLFVFNSCVVFVCKELVKQSGSGGGSSGTGKKKTSSSFSSFNGHSQPTKNSHSAEIIRYQSLIPVSEVQVRSVPATSTTSSQNLKTRYKYQWELFRCSSINSNSSLLTKTNKRSANNDGKVYLLASPTNEARNLFLRKIRYIIRESVRNMSLPLTRSPSSKSLSPKKLSSSSTTHTNSSCSQSTSLSPVIGGSKYIERGESNYVTSIEVNN